MGPRQNRKRIRHRPSNRARKARDLEPTPIQPAPITAASESLPITLRSTRTQHPPQLHAMRSQGPAPSIRQALSPRPVTSIQMLARLETDKMRDRRIFGGVTEDEADAADLRGPMLDVVLDLFNGVDYDDCTC